MGTAAGPLVLVVKWMVASGDTAWTFPASIGVRVVREGSQLGSDDVLGDGGGGCLTVSRHAHAGRLAHELDVDLERPVDQAADLHLAELQRPVLGDPVGGCRQRLEGLERAEVLVDDLHVHLLDVVGGGAADDQAAGGVGDVDDRLDGGYGVAARGVRREGKDGGGHARGDQPDCELATGRQGRWTLHVGSPSSGYGSGVPPPKDLRSRLQSPRWLLDQARQHGHVSVDREVMGSLFRLGARLPEAPAGGPAPPVRLPRDHGVGRVGRGAGPDHVDCLDRERVLHVRHRQRHGQEA